MHYLLLYDVVPDYAERRVPLRAAHLAHARAAVDRGELVLAGALANPVDGAVLLFRGDSPAAAEAFARGDPYVQRGLVTRWRVREWTTVVGPAAEVALPPGMESCSEHKELSSMDPGTLPPEAVAAQRLNQIALGYIGSAALQVVLKLDIPDRLAAGPRPVTELGREAGVDVEALYRVMRALASIGVFEEQASRVFALNLPARMLCKGPQSMRDMGLWITSPLHYRVYAEMLHAVQTGQPAVEKVTGMPVFEFFPKHPDYSEIFNNAMTAFSAVVVPAVLDVYDFSGIGVLVDVAGGHGQLLRSILAKYPDMRGVLFDLEHVIAGAVPQIEAAGMGNRLSTASGDFFKAVPRGDAYIMKHIIHDWDDGRALVILRNIHAALDGRRGGRVILVESVLQPGNVPDMGKLIDLEMLMMPGGKERTADEFRELLGRAGFGQVSVIPTQAPLWVVEGRIA